MEPAADLGPYDLADGVGIDPGIDEHAALGLAVGQLAVGLAQPGVELQRLGLEAVGGLAAAPARRPLEAHLDRHIEDAGQVGPRGADCDALQAPDHPRIDVAENAL